jgi:hypothetical protein
LLCEATILNPLDIISKGAKLNPAFTRIVFGVPLIAAALAIALKLVDDPKTAIIGGIITILGAVIAFVVSILGKVEGLQSTAIWFVRVCLLLFCAVTILIVTSVFFRWPQPLQCIVRPLDDCSRQAGNELNSVAPAEVAKPPTAASPSVNRSAFTVYVQFAGYQRPTVQGFSSSLKATGWKVPGEERIATAAGLNEIRYRADKDKAAAELLASDLAKAQQKAVDAIKIRRIPIITDGTLEVWISQ